MMSNLRKILLVFLVGMFAHTAGTADPYANLKKTDARGTSISGHITLFGKDLANVIVVLEELRIVIKTSDKGVFSIYPVKRGDYTLKFYHPRVNAKTVPVRLREELHLNLDLEPKLYRESVPMTAGNEFPLDPLSLTRETGKNSSYYPGFLGVSTFYLSTLPSVSSPSGYFELPIVRGKPTSGNNYLFNGNPITYAYHGLGLFSAVNKDDLQEIRAYRGVAPVTYRNSGFGTFDYTMKSPEGSESDYGLRFYGLAYPGVSVQRLIGSNGHLSFSGRRTLADLVDLMITPPGEESMVFAIGDFQGSAAVELAKGHRLELAVFGMQNNNGDLSEGSAVRNSDITASLRYDMDITNKAKVTMKYSFQNANLEIFGSHFILDPIYNLADMDKGDNRNIDYFGEKQQIHSVKINTIFSPVARQVVDFGVEVRYQSRYAEISAGSQFLDYSFPTDDDPLRQSTFIYDEDGLDYSAYLRYLSLYKKFGWDTGVRGTYYPVLKRWAIEPSLMGFWFVDEKTKVYAGFSSTQVILQPRWEVALFSNDNIGQEPMIVWKSEIGARRFLFPNLPLTFLLFAELWENYPILQSTDVADLSLANAINLFEARGDGRSFGGEIIGEYKVKDILTRFSYSYIYSDYEGQEYELNRSHMLTISIIYQQSENWTTAAIFRIWSTFPGVNASWGSDNADDRYWLALDPITQLSLRFTRKLNFAKQGSRLYFELGYFQNIMYLPQFPPRGEFNSTSALETALYGRQINTSKSYPDSSLNLGLGVEVVF